MGIPGNSGYFKEMLSVYDYIDYRVYLKERVEEMRQSASILSFRYVGKKVGMDPSQVVKIVQGQLHLTEAKIPVFAHFLGLNGKEAEYFRLLVLFNRARNAEESRSYFEQMVSLSGVPSLELKRDQYLFFAKWYNCAVWCALASFDCKNNFKELGAYLAPQISAAEAKEAIQLLERLGLIRKNDQGIWKSTDQNLTTGKDWNSIAIRAYQQEMIRLGAEALERFPKGDRDISSLTLGISPDMLEEVRTLTEDFRRTLAKLSNQCPATDRVYQLNVQLFPLTARRKTEEPA